MKVNSSSSIGCFSIVWIPDSTSCICCKNYFLQFSCVNIVNSTEVRCKCIYAWSSVLGYHFSEGAECAAIRGFHVQCAKERGLWRRLPLARTVHRLRLRTFSNKRTPTSEFCKAMERGEKEP